MSSMIEQKFQADIDAIRAIASVPSMFDVITQTTGMGFVAITAVVDGRWIACDVRDDIDFGVKPSDELTVETTI
ncbi:MAG: sensor histidine kinase, partial [Rhizobiaceae bacterium]|nr:sensor histidine kinase [Rhizobiaceae bacterium]